MLTRLRIAWLIAVLGIVAAPAAPALPQSSGDETELARPTPSWAAACTASGPRRWRWRCRAPGWLVRSSTISGRSRAGTRRTWT